jgi:hypothetical protein
MPLSSKVSIRTTGVHGHCWFASSSFVAGEAIWWARSPDAPHTDIHLTYEEINLLPSDVRSKWLSLAYQVGSNLMCGFDPSREPLYDELIEDYVNHSCDGNAWYEGADLLVAMRDIAEGEEIYYDYALTENHPSFAFPQCMCGKAICRGRISGDDWRREDLQKKYGQHFLPHVLESIKQQHAAAAATTEVAAATETPVTAEAGASAAAVSTHVHQA